MERPLPNRLDKPPRQRAGRPTSAEQLLRPPPESIPTGRVLPCRACGRGRYRCNGAARADGAKPLRCTHCASTATLLPNGTIQRR